MIVIAIIAIIAAITIPNLLESRKHANQANAIGSLHSIVIAQQQIRDGDKYACTQCVASGSRQPASRYAASTDAEFLSVLAAFTPEPTSPQILNKGGYCFLSRYAWTAPPDGLHHQESQFLAIAWPRSPGNSGENEYATNQTGTLYYRVDPNTIAWNDINNHESNPNNVNRFSTPYDCSIDTPPWAGVGK
jgi:type II secretory pathway pseudopilin PulG